MKATDSHQLSYTSTSRSEQPFFGAKPDQAFFSTTQSRSDFFFNPSSSGIQQEPGQSRLLTDQTDEPGKINKAQFMLALKKGIEPVAEKILAPAGLAQSDCPDLNYWIEYYQTKNATYVERAIIRYAPLAATAKNWQEMLSAVLQRVEQALVEHVTTGENHIEPETPPSPLEASRPEIRPISVTQAPEVIQRKIGKKRRNRNRENLNELLGLDEGQRQQSHKGLEANESSSSVKYTMDDIRKPGNTTIENATMANVFPEGRMLGNQKLVHVNTDLTKGDEYMPVEERVDFSNYFSDDTWIMDAVFKAQGKTNFLLNEVISEQAIQAKKPLGNMQRVVVKNIINEDTKRYIEKTYVKGENEWEKGDQLKGLMAGTTLGKSVCWTVINGKYPVPIHAQVIVPGIHLIITLGAYTGNEEWAKQVLPAKAHEKLLRELRGNNPPAF